MNIISSYQNNVLVRQCGEAVRNKEIDQKSRIKNKEEYHQPGDVDIIYLKKDKIEENKKNKNKEKRKTKSMKLCNKAQKNQTKK
jgi:hypothetical protein